jgi:hypothetical protein
MEQALSDFATLISALDMRIAALEKQCACCGCSVAADVVPEPEPETVVPQPEPEAAENETIVNLDNHSPDEIQDSLWQTFKAISDSGKTVVVTFAGDHPRNMIVYADDATQPVYRNASIGELRIIQAIEGTLIATLQPGEVVKTARVDGTWTTV